MNIIDHIKTYIETINNELNNIMINRNYLKSLLILMLNNLGTIKHNPNYISDYIIKENLLMNNMMEIRDELKSNYLLDKLNELIIDVKHYANIILNNILTIDFTIIRDMFNILGIKIIKYDEEIKKIEQINNTLDYMIIS